MRLIDEQRKEDSRRIVRPCSHLLCEDGEDDVEDVEGGESFISLSSSRAISILFLLLNSNDFFVISQNKIKFSFIFFEKKKVK